MSIFIIEPASSFISRIDPRCRLIAIFMLAITIALCQSIKVVLPVLIILISGTIIFGGNPSHLMRRLVEINFFMLFVFLFLPFSIDGDPLFSLAGNNYSMDGFMIAALMVLKANAIMVLIYFLIGCMEPAAIAHTLQAIGTPAVFVQILFFMIRYIDVLHDELKKILIAAKARGFNGGCNAHCFRTYANMFGMLFVRSLERSERIYDAMKCRGFDGRYYSMITHRTGLSDWVFLVIVFLAAVFIINF